MEQTQTMDRHSQARQHGAAYLLTLRVFQLEIKQYWRKRGDTLKALGLNIQIILLFALLYGPAPERLSELALGAFLLAIIFAINLNSEQFLHDEARSGALEQWLFYSLSPYFLVLAKIVAFWVVSTLPLLLMLPLFYLLLYAPSEQIWLWLRVLLLLSPTLVCLAALASALSLGLKARAFFIQLIALPLSVPVLIMALQIITDPTNALFYSLILAAFVLLALALSPLLILAILRATLP